MLIKDPLLMPVGHDLRLLQYLVDPVRRRDVDLGLRKDCVQNLGDITQNSGADLRRPGEDIATAARSPGDVLPWADRPPGQDSEVLTERHVDQDRTAEPNLGNGQSLVYPAGHILWFEVSGFFAARLAGTCHR